MHEQGGGEWSGSPPERVWASPPLHKKKNPARRKKFWASKKSRKIAVSHNFLKNRSKYTPKRSSSLAGRAGKFLVPPPPSEGGRGESLLTVGNDETARRHKSTKMHKNASQSPFVDKLWNEGPKNSAFNQLWFEPFPTHRALPATDTGQKKIGPGQLAAELHPVGGERKLSGRKHATCILNKHRKT